MPTKKTEEKLIATKPAKKTEVKKAEVKKTPKPKVEKVAEVKAEIVKPPKTTIDVGSIHLKGKDAELVKKYQRKKDDTGSTEVQITLFTAKINSLSKHLKAHQKDSDSKRGLLIMVGKRRRLLTYLKKTDPKQYEKILVDLGLRK